MDLQNMMLAQKPLEKKMLRETVREFLINSILTKKYRPGERIIETQVARDLQVSQGTVREAMRELEAMGFIETEVYKGARVRSYSKEELVEVWEVRAILESFAIAKGFDSIRSEIKALGKIIDEMVVCAQQRNFLKQIELDMQFHKVILTSAKNRALYKVWNALGLSFWTYFGIYSTVPQSDCHFKNHAERHRVIYEALRSGDRAKAEAAIRDHFIKNKDLLKSRKLDEE